MPCRYTRFVRPAPLGSSPRCIRSHTATLWTVEDIEEHKAAIGADPSLNLQWNVVESLPIHERIKLGEGDLTTLFDTYRQSMRNLAGLRDQDDLLQLHAGGRLDPNRAPPSSPRRRPRTTLQFA